MWTTDVGLHQVQKWSQGGALLLSLGEAFVPGSDQAHFCQPAAVAVTSKVAPLPSPSYLVAQCVMGAAGGGVRGRRVLQRPRRRLRQGRPLPAPVREAGRCSQGFPHSLFRFCSETRDNGFECWTRRWATSASPTTSRSTSPWTISTSPTGEAPSLPSSCLHHSGCRVEDERADANDVHERDRHSGLQARLGLPNCLLNRLLLPWHSFFPFCHMATNRPH